MIHRINHFRLAVMKMNRSIEHAGVPSVGIPEMN